MNQNCPEFTKSEEYYDDEEVPLICASDFIREQEE